jgi:hypothetical protein
MATLLINAGPGTGKSYTLAKLPGYLRAQNREAYLRNTKHTEEQLAIWEWVRTHIDPPTDGSHHSIMYGAYNADAVEKQSEVTPDYVSCRTIHGHGASYLMKKYKYLGPPNGRRGQVIVEQITGKDFNKMPDKFKWLSTLRHIEKLKEELLAPTEENFKHLHFKYDTLVAFELHSDMVAQAEKIIPEMKKVSKQTGIEFIDQVWLPTFLLNSPIYDIGKIDECQDLSPLRLRLCRLLCRDLIFVGDPDQAINAFAGADAHSFEKIEAIADAVLPLKKTFRLPPNIVKRANQLSPRAKLVGVKETAGKERSITISELPDVIKEYMKKSDEGQVLILCRYNAPLINTAFKLMASGVPCYVAGRQLVESLVKIIEGRKAESIEELRSKLKQYFHFISMEAVANDNLQILEALEDKKTCLMNVLKECSKINEVIPKLKELFAKKKHVPRLMTCHKAKGQESRFVFLLYPPIPSTKARTEDAIQQEKNLEFVATTRTMEDLYFVHED